MKAKQKMSAEGRKKISDAQKARWARQRASQKKPKVARIDDPALAPKLYVSSVGGTDYTPSIGYAKPEFTGVSFTSSQAQKKLDLIQQILNL